MVDALFFLKKPQTGRAINVDLKLNEMTIGGEQFQFQLTDKSRLQDVEAL